MASESTGEDTLTISLSGELDDWLTERADRLGVDRETVFLQLLASYRAVTELEDDEGSVPAEEAIDEVVADRIDRQVKDHLREDIEEAVERALAETVDERVEAAVQSQITAAVETAVTDRLADVTEGIENRLGGRLDDLENTHRADVNDLRERVIQLKREIDGKAETDHGHDELAAVTDLQAELATIDSHVQDIESRVEFLADDHAAQIEDNDDELEQLRERLETVAWVVNDLREAHESDDVDAVDRLKRAAAKADIERAKCEGCGTMVSIGLLTGAECPHCGTTVTNVEPAGSFFGKPRLLSASQLESGETDE